MDQAEHGFAVRLYAGKLEVEDAVTVEGKAFKLLNLPYYLGGKVEEYVEWFSN